VDRSSVAFGQRGIIRQSPRVRQLPGSWQFGTGGAIDRARMCRKGAIVVDGQSRICRSDSADVGFTVSLSGSLYNGGETVVCRSLAIAQRAILRSSSLHSQSLATLMEVEMKRELPIKIPQDKIADFCKQHHILKLSLFGSVLRNDFHADSDIDVLVEFESNHVPGLIRLAGMEIELTEMLGHKADLRTPEDLSHYFRQKVLDLALVQYVH
jgi:uncharacterized protein